MDNLSAVSILIPNETEAQILLGEQPGSEYDAEKLALGLKEKYNIPVVIITLGEDGIVGVDDEWVWSKPALKVDVADTSGAGDEFCSALAVGIVNGMSIREASGWACKVASLSVTKAGTIPAYLTMEQVNKKI